MKRLLMLYRHLPCLRFGASLLIGLSACAAMAPRGATAQARGPVELIDKPYPLLQHVASQGYLGIDLADVNNENAPALKLKEVRGAIITLIDHDAPAGKIGLRINDVVLMLNGQTVEGAEQARRMLREIPPGHKVSLVVSRDGNQQTLAIELADRSVLEHEVWSSLDKGNSGLTQAPAVGTQPATGSASPSRGFHIPFFGGSLNVGALLEPLTSQMAEYLSVSNGLMVKQVTRNSLSDEAGLRVFDVIVKVGARPIASLSDWDRALHASQGNPVQVTVLRERQLQTLTFQVDSKHHQGKL